jgi:DNA polymerase-3 subunit alpha
MHLNVRTQYSPLQSLIRIETYLDELVHRQL